MTATRFPHLKHLMGCYFNQDFGFDDKDEVEVLRDYARLSWPTDVAAMVAEIDRLLGEPVAGLQGRFARETGEWNMEVAETDAGTQDCLRMAREVIVREPNTAKL